MADPVMGLAPTSPLMAPPPVVVTAAPARIVKWAADPKLTGGGPAAAGYGCRATKANARTMPISVCFLLITLSAGGHMPTSNMSL